MEFKLLFCICSNYLGYHIAQKYFWISPQKGTLPEEIWQEVTLDNFDAKAIEIAAERMSGGAGLYGANSNLLK